MKKPTAKKDGFVKARIRRWLDIAGDIDRPMNWGDIDSVAAGQRISESRILSISAAFACTRLISEAAGTLPYSLYQKSNAGRVSHTTHPLYDILRHAPNSGSTPAQFWSAMVSSMLLWGNAFAVIKRSSSGDILSLKMIHPKLVTDRIYTDGIITRYVINDEEVSARQILHIANFGTDGQWGLSSIAYGAQVFGNALAGVDAANNTFERGLAPTVALKIDRVIKPEQREDMRKYMSGISGALNAGKTAVLEAGMDAKTIGINPRDAQLLESRAFSTEEVCRWFGVDPSMVGHGSAVSNWGTGLEQKMIGFLTFTLRPILSRIEQAVNKQLLPAEQQKTIYSEFNIEGLLRADSAGRANFYSTMINNGTFTRDEVRAKENLPLMGGNSAKQTIQSGFVTLDSLGQDNEKTNHSK